MLAVKMNLRFLLNLSLLIRLQMTSLKSVLKNGMNQRLQIARSIHRKCQQANLRLKFMTTSPARLMAVKIRTFLAAHVYCDYLQATNDTDRFFKLTVSQKRDTLYVFKPKDIFNIHCDLLTFSICSAKMYNIHRQSA